MAMKCKTPPPDRDADGFYVLNRKYSSLYKRVVYTSRHQNLIVNRITEYDIKAANITMLSQANMLKQSTIESLAELPKHDREVAIGKAIAKNPELKEVIATGIRRAKEKLFRANGILDEDVLAIRNDAVFVIGRRLKYTTFGEIVFRETPYSAYLYLDGIEIFYQQNQEKNIVSIKGVKDEIVEHPDHQKGIVSFFVNVMRYLVAGRKAHLRRYLIEFTCAYKDRDLPIEFYRELNSSNVYRTKMELDGFSFNLSILKTAASTFCESTVPSSTIFTS